MQREIRVEREELDDAEEVHHRAESHVVEEVLRGLRAGLSGFVDLSGGDGFGEGQFRIFHHDAAHERYEEHAEDAAGHHEDG